MCPTTGNSGAVVRLAALGDERLRRPEGRVSTFLINVFWSLTTAWGGGVACFVRFASARRSWLGGRMCLLFGWVLWETEDGSKG